MKKLIIGLSVCVVSSFAIAAPAAVCSNAAGSGTAVTGDANNFVKTTFTPKCSANTHVYIDQSASAAGVGSISLKGNQIFGGHTSGGAVSKLPTNGDCASSGCTSTNASDASTTMLTAASS